MLRCLFITLVLTSCTISFSNISTSGRSQTETDEDQAVTPQVEADLSLPIKAI